MVKRLHIVMLGSGAVGKTSITFRFTAQQFLDEYDPTIEETYSHEVKTKDGVIPIDILDTAGQEEFKSIQEHYIRKGDGFVLVYSVDNKESFRDMKQVHQKICRMKDKPSEEIPMVICGNKCDLPDKLKVVDREEVQAYAKEHSLLFYECSAKDNVNVTEAFTELVEKTNESIVPEKGGGCCSIQ